MSAKNKGIRYKVQVVVICQDPTSLLLLQTNSERGHFWQNVTGSAEKGEELMAAAKRELLEETGLVAAEFIELNYHFNYADPFSAGEIQEHTYLCVLPAMPSSVKLDSREHDNFKWIPLEQLAASCFKFKSNYEAAKIASEIIKNSK